MSLFGGFRNLFHKDSEPVKNNPVKNGTTIDYNSAKVKEGKALFEKTMEYEKSAGTDADDQLIFDQYKEAATLGCAEAQYELAKKYRLRRDHTEYKKWMNESAEHGYAEAQYEMAKNEGSTFMKIKWYTQAADQGHVESCFELADVFKKDHNQYEALKYYRKAAEMGHPEAMYALSDLYRFGDLNNGTFQKNTLEAKKWLLLSAEKKHQKAMERLAKEYRSGGYGSLVLKDPEKAYHLYRDLALSGSLRHLEIMDEMVQKGEMPKTYKQENLDLWKQFAEDGYEIAINKVAGLLKGTIDKKEIFQMYKKCAEKGSVTAVDNVAERFKGMISQEEIFQMYKNCAERENASRAAQYKLAELYRYGKYTEQNYAEAFNWYCKAATAEPTSEMLRITNQESAYPVVYDILRYLKDHEDPELDRYAFETQTIYISYEGTKIELTMGTSRLNALLPEAFKYHEQWKEMWGKREQNK